MLGAFFDDSGTHTSSPAVVIGGLLGTDEQWDAFEAAWTARLAHPLPGKPPLNQFHLSPCRAITHDDLPEILLGLELQEIYGIGERMEQRLHRAGIFTVAELWQASPMRLRRVWGGINGLLFHQMLHGVDIQPPSSRFAKSMGHQHVLEPELRTNDGAANFARHC